MADEQQRTIDTLMQQCDALLTSNRQLVDSVAKAVIDAGKKPVRLAFTYNLAGQDAHHFKFEAAADDLADPDVRDAMAKGRALLEAVVAEKRREAER